MYDLGMGKEGGRRGGEGGSRGREVDRYVGS